ncbi:MAG: type II toxin-antitoxin system death-on-curing family toxin [Rhabdochlamydiaceae bacterium]|jgi:death-on-curing protein
MIKYLTLEQILRLHDAALEKFGGLKGVRDSNLLLSSIEHPKAAMFGEDLYPTITNKAAAYLFHIVRNHPFNDGNKRTGCGAAYLFLKINKVTILFGDDAYEDFVVKVAQGKKQMEEVTYFLEYGKEML